jgi:hypothetical protein
VILEEPHPGELLARVKRGEPVELELELLAFAVGRGHHPIHPPDDAGWSLLAGTSVGAPLQLVHYSVMCGVIIGGEARQFDDRTELWQWAHLTSPELVLLVLLGQYRRVSIGRVLLDIAHPGQQECALACRRQLSSASVVSETSLVEHGRCPTARIVRAREAGKEVRERAVFSRIARTGLGNLREKQARGEMVEPAERDIVCAVIDLVDAMGRYQPAEVWP